MSVRATQGPGPLWTEQLSAWSTLATAVLTLALVVVAAVAGVVAVRALQASRLASEAALLAAEAARAANEQARLDSLERTRPYVFIEMLPGLAGVNSFDLRITNSGKSAARNLTMDYSDWPENLDGVGIPMRRLFETPRTLPPGGSLRVMWQLLGEFADGSTEVGMPSDGRITASYTSDDASEPEYRETSDVMIDNSGLWPVPDDGPDPKGLHGESLQFYRLGRILTRHVGALGR